MNPSAKPPPNPSPSDDDVADRARPGHGVPSQDPNPAAQHALSPEEAEREARSAMTGGGVVGGAAIGAGIGVAAGAVGAMVGGTLGAVAGALGGAAAGGMIGPEAATRVESGGTDRGPASAGRQPRSSGSKT
jgi:hypothetical protein